MSQYLREHGSRATPQSAPIQEHQVEDSAGGYVWSVDDWTLARRFLILGTEGGSYYVGERTLTADAAASVRRCIAADGIKAVRLICEVSEGGLAPRNDPALYALAMATAAESETVRRAAWDALPAVARTGTHLLHFCAFRELFGGWGRRGRIGVSRWFNDKEPEALAYQFIKYRQRDGWSQLDALRTAHPHPPTAEHDALYRWVTKGIPPAPPQPLVDGFIRAQASQSPAETAALIRDYGLPREAVRTDHLKAPEVWAALLNDMPMTALIRNLATLTRVGLLVPFSEAERIVLDQLGDQQRLHDARVHPIAILSALRVYAAGHGARGAGEWVPCGSVVDALDAAFYAGFREVHPAGKRTLLAFDVSGSMAGFDVLGLAGVSVRDASAAMGLVTAATEPYCAAMAFSGPYSERGFGGGRSGPDAALPFPLTGKDRLDDVISRMEAMPFGGTDCAVPMQYALREHVDVDTFIVYTDNETWAGQEHPSQALQRYRERSGIGARLIVVGMAANEFSIADPADSGMLDVVGFDASAPALMAEFSRGGL